MDTITVRGLHVYGYHGVSEAEREVGHRLEIDIEVRTDCRSAGETDNLDESVDYSKLVTIASEVASGAKRKLIESVAEGIASRVLAVPRVKEVVVEVRKTNPPLAEIVESVGVRIERRVVP